MLKIIHFDNCIITKIGFQTLVKQSFDANFINYTNQSIKGFFINDVSSKLVLINIDTEPQVEVEKLISEAGILNMPIIVISASILCDKFIFLKDKRVKGFLCINSEKNEINKCINSVMDNRLYVSGQFNLSNLISSKKSVSGYAPISDLTEKETEVFSAIIQGKTTLEIAEILHNSKRTIECHRRNIAEKLNLQGQGRLTRYLLKHKSYYEQQLSLKVNYAS